MVFRYPDDPSVDYIKRVVGLPGDKVAYPNKRLTINGREVPLKEAGDYLLKDKIQYLKQYTETLGTTEHAILVDTSEAGALPYAKQFPQRENCIYNNSGFVLHGSGRPLLHDGRQPRQQQRQPRTGASCPKRISSARRFSSG